MKILMFYVPNISYSSSQWVTQHHNLHLHRVGLLCPRTAHWPEGLVPSLRLVGLK